MPQKHLWNSFLMYLLVEILQLEHEISNLAEAPNKTVLLEIFSKFTDKHKKQSSGGALSKNTRKIHKKHISRSLFFNKVTRWKPETVRSSHWRCSLKQGALKSFANFAGKNRCWSLFLMKFQFWGPATLLKKTPTLVISCKICKPFKNNYFE